jgi:poly [ADP-ribose] polymerase
MGIFSKCQIALDLDTSLGFKKKAAIKSQVIENDGIISYIVTKKVSHLVVSNVSKCEDSHKVQMAVKYGIPVVSLSFLDTCVAQGKLLDADSFVVAGKTAADEFRTGKIVAPKGDKQKKIPKPSVNLSQLKFKSWPHDDSYSHHFDEEKYEVARYAMLKKFDTKSRLTQFCCLEIHVVPFEEKSEEEEERPRCRVFMHTGVLEKKEKDGELGKKQCAYLSSPLEGEQAFSLLYHRYTGSPHHMTKEHHISAHIGSDTLKKVMAEVRLAGVGSSVLQPEVGELVEYVWAEATGELKEILSVPVESIKTDQVEKAEAALMSIRKLVDGMNPITASTLPGLWEEFYSALPHKPTAKITTLDKRTISHLQDLCQLVRDIVAVGESTNWSTRSSTDSKLRSLRCDVQRLDPLSEEYQNISDHVIRSQDDSSTSIEILNIYSIHRAVENSNFTYHLDNKQLLFHSSSVS